MPSDEPILTISVASNLLRLHPRTLMLYERSGLITPHRTGTKRRLFSIGNLEELQFVKYLTHKQGVNLAGCRNILEAIRISEKEGINLKKLLFPSFRVEKLI